MSALAFDGVELTYQSADPSLSLASLTIEPGERVALLGSSGAGKSSLLKLAAGLVAPTRGTVSTLGCQLLAGSARQTRATRRRVGLISQGIDLVDPLSVAHNVSAGRIGERSLLGQIGQLARPGDLATISAVLATVGMQHKLKARVADLSGGERQRIAIARLRYQEPELILADEPVASLDPARGREVMALLAELTPNQTLVASLHDPALAIEFCHRIIGLRAGMVAFDLAASEVDEACLDQLYSLAQ